MSTDGNCEKFSAIVIGTGFGGAVTACRLVEAGYHICVLERGRPYGKDDFPRYPTEGLFVPEEKTKSTPETPADFSGWLWSQDHGLFDIREMGDAIAIQAAGYGGGSLIYANVHLRPPRSLFDDGWPVEYQNGALDEYFDLAAFMLRVSPIPHKLAKTLQHKRAAERIDSPPGSWFRTPLAINFEPEGGLNPFGQEQQPCDMRGRCCQGCDRQAKNTLDLNYLARAKASSGGGSASVRVRAEVTTITRDSDSGMYRVTYNDLIRGKRADGAFRTVTVCAQHVFLCAGSLGSTELLYANSALLDLTTSGGSTRSVHIGSRMPTRSRLSSSAMSHTTPTTGRRSRPHSCISRP